MMKETKKDSDKKNPEEKIKVSLLSGKKVVSSVVIENEKDFQDIIGGMENFEKAKIFFSDVKNFVLEKEIEKYKEIRNKLLEKQDKIAKKIKAIQDAEEKLKNKSLAEF